MSDLTFREFQALNRRRCSEAFHDPFEWPSEWPEDLWVREMPR